MLRCVCCKRVCGAHVVCACVVRVLFARVRCACCMCVCGARVVCVNVRACSFAWLCGRCTLERVCVYNVHMRVCVYTACMYMSVCVCA